MDDVRVLAAGRELTGWQEVEVSRGLDRAAAGFSLRMPRTTLDRRGTGDLLPLLPGDPVEIYLGADRVVSGYVDQVAPSRKAKDHTVRIAGRSKTADLIDCSATNSPGQWKSATVLAIARAIAKPFGLVVTQTGAAGTALENFELEQGETAFDAIERAARMRSLLVRDDANGGLVLAQAGSTRGVGALRHLDGPDFGPDPDNNVIQSAGKFSTAGRFSQIIVKGQSKSTDLNFGKVAAAVDGQAFDRNVSRYRPKILKAEKSTSAEEAQKRADWEVARRAGKSVEYACTVRGWRQTGESSTGPGPLWDADLLVPVLDSAVGLFRDLLISEVAWRLDPDQGKTTDLTLQPVEAFRPKPILVEVKGNNALLEWDEPSKRFVNKR